MWQSIERRRAHRYLRRLAAKNDDGRLPDIYSFSSLQNIVNVTDADKDDEDGSSQIISKFVPVASLRRVSELCFRRCKQEEAQTPRLYYILLDACVVAAVKRYAASKTQNKPRQNSLSSGVLYEHKVTSSTGWEAELLFHKVLKSQSALSYRSNVGRQRCEEGSARNKLKALILLYSS